MGKPNTVIGFTDNVTEFSEASKLEQAHWHVTLNAFMAVTLCAGNQYAGNRYAGNRYAVTRYATNPCVVITTNGNHTNLFR